jgi:hypothetical protein
MRVENINGKYTLIGDSKPQPRPALATGQPPWFSAWEPTPEMVDFFRLLFASVRSSGRVFDWHLLDWVECPVEWRVPASGNLYHIDTERRKLILVEGAVDDWHWLNIKTVAVLGWAAELASKKADTGAGKTFSSVFAHIK